MEQIELVELGDRRFELQIPPRHLQFLDQIGGSGEEDAPSVLDQGEADGGREVALATARRAEHQHVGALGQPAVASGHGHDLRLRDHRDRLEGEAVEGLAWRQMRLGEVAFDPAIGTFCQLVLGDGGEEARRRPTLAIGRFGELRSWACSNPDHGRRK